MQSVAISQPMHCRFV